MISNSKPLPPRIARNRFAFIATLAVTCGVVVCAEMRAENWPQWRGPRGDGTSLEESVPTEWSPGRNIVWKMRIPGAGHASPIVWNDRLFLVTCQPDLRQRTLVCLDRLTGQELWQRAVLESDLENKHQLNSWASSTPATDGELVYVAFLSPDGTRVQFEHHKDRFVTPGSMFVAAFDFDGNQRWVARPGRFASIHGFCSAPVLFEDKVIVNGDHDGDAYLVALDRRTGETIWKIVRENRTRSYVTPIIRDLHGRTQLILSGNQCVASYDPRDGSRHWIIDGPTEQFVASVVDHGDLLFVTGGYPDRHILAIRPDGHGNVTETHIQWRARRGAAYVPSPVATNGYFFVVSDNGIASCFQAQTGRRAWQQRVGRHYSASLVTADKMVYMTSDDGRTKVIRAAEPFQILSDNSIGESCYASLAISRGNIYIRGEAHLFCIGQGAKGGH